MQREPLELYIHIPFCVKKCLYCDFLSFGTEDERLKDTPCLPSRKEPVPQNYIEALCREIGEWGRKKTLRHRPVVSVFFWRRDTESYVGKADFPGDGGIKGDIFDSEKCGDHNGVKSGYTDTFKTESHAFLRN